MITDGRKYLEELDGPLTVADCLEAIINRDNITQTELAKRLGVNKTYVNNILKGKQKVSVEKVVEIAKILGEPPTVLIKAAINDDLKEKNINYVVSLRKKVA